MIGKLCPWCRGTGRCYVDNIPYPCQDCANGAVFYCPECREWTDKGGRDQEMCDECLEDRQNEKGERQ